jgi:hypothetical protein
MFSHINLRSFTFTQLFNNFEIMTTDIDILNILLNDDTSFIAIIEL